MSDTVTVTKEDILKKHGIYAGFRSTYAYDEILAAMDEWQRLTASPVSETPAPAVQEKDDAPMEEALKELQIVLDRTDCCKEDYIIADVRKRVQLTVSNLKAASQLSSPMDEKGKQKEAIIDIMNADAKDGLYSDEKGWIRVEDKPLITFQKDGDGKKCWFTTEAGTNEFIAAVETNEGWWIRHCVIEEGIGLCVVGDDDNEPAGWEISDITHWQPLPSAPKEK